MSYVVKRAVQDFLRSRGYQITRILPNQSLDASDGVMLYLRSAYRFRTVIDIGANNGEFLAFLASFFKAEKALAFEPLAAARAEIEGRGIAGLTIFPHALSDTTGTTTFDVNAYGPASSMLPVSEISASKFPQTSRIVEKVRVPVARLDDLVDPDTLPGSVFVKMDVQGVEDKVIAGGQKCLSKAEAILIEMSYRAMYDGQALFEEVHAPLAALGFRLAGVKNQLSAENGEPLFGHFLYRRSA